jgi:hypothetical protein
MRYPSDLTDEEWTLIRGHFEAARPKGGRPRSHAPRELLNAIFYVMRSGRQWEVLAESTFGVDTADSPYCLSPLATNATCGRFGQLQELRAPRQCVVLAQSPGHGNFRAAMPALLISTATLQTRVFEHWPQRADEGRAPQQQQEGNPLMTKTYAQIQNQIQALSREAEQVKRKEVDGKKLEDFAV